MQFTKIPQLSKTKKLYSFSQIPEPRKFVQEFQNSFQIIKAGLDINNMMYTPGNILFNVGDCKVAQEMVSDRSTEVGIKKGLSNYLQVAKEVKEREHFFDLTVEESQKIEDKKQNRLKIAQSKYEEEKKEIKERSTSKRRSISKKQKQQRMSTIFNNIKIEQKKNKNKVVESRYIINKRHKQDKLKEREAIRSSSKRSRSRSNHMNDKESKVQKSEKCQILQNTMKNTRLFINMLKLVKQN